MTTIQEKWKAFYRIYRLVRKGQGLFEGEEALRTLCFGDDDLWAFYELIRARKDNLAARSTCGKFLRKQFLDLATRERLYGTFQERCRWDEHDKRLALKLHEQGVEMTPLEVTESRRKGFRQLRQYCTEQGLSLPKDDMEMLAMLINLKQND